MPLLYMKDPHPLTAPRLLHHARIIMAWWQIIRGCATVFRKLMAYTSGVPQCLWV
ncbi:MAG: hypothetical protein QM520_05405 [Gammaproteobacteria bacterium]|nr:hypothetical protein [Gammaproteobacteria bacterium]